MAVSNLADPRPSCNHRLGDVAHHEGLQMLSVRPHKLVDGSPALVCAERWHGHDIFLHRNFLQKGAEVIEYLDAIILL